MISYQSLLLSTSVLNDIITVCALAMYKLGTQYENLCGFRNPGEF